MIGILREIEIFSMNKSLFALSDIIYKSICDPSLMDISSYTNDRGTDREYGYYTNTVQSMIPIYGVKQCLFDNLKLCFKTSMKNITRRFLQKTFMTPNSLEDFHKFLKKFLLKIFKWYIYDLICIYVRSHEVSNKNLSIRQNIEDILETLNRAEAWRFLCENSWDLGYW